MPLNYKLKNGIKVYSKETYKGTKLWHTWINKQCDISFV